MSFLNFFRFPNCECAIRFVCSLIVVAVLLEHEEARHRYSLNTYRFERALIFEDVVDVVLLL